MPGDPMGGGFRRDLNERMLGAINAGEFRRPSRESLAMLGQVEPPGTILPGGHVVTTREYYTALSQQPARSLNVPTGSELPTGGEGPGGGSSGTPTPSSASALPIGFLTSPLGIIAAVYLGGKLLKVW